MALMEETSARVHSWVLPTDDVVTNYYNDVDDKTRGVKVLVSSSTRRSPPSGTSPLELVQDALSIQVENHAARP